MRNDLEIRTVALIKQFRGQLSDKFVEMYIVNAEHNEWGIALEDLCTQLYEEDIKPNANQLAEIKTLAEIMRLPASTYDFL